MALVDYGSSSGEEDELCSEELNNKKTNLNNEINQNNKQINSNDHVFKIPSIPPSLPTSKSLPKPSSSILNTEKTKLINNLSVSKENGKIRIFLPSYKGTKEDDEYEEDDDEKEFRKLRYSSSKGSGLKSLLPPPKNQIKKTTSSFIPNVLKRKTQETNQPIKRAFIQKSIDDDDDDDNSINFFSFEQDNKIDTKLTNYSTNELNVKSNKFETDLIKTKFSKPTKPISSTSISITNQPMETDYQKERKIKYMIEKKFGEEIGDDVQIHDVNIANHLNDNLDYIKTLSEERDQEVTGPAPSHTAKRKHQITYLAFQAKQNEIKLKNEWAKGNQNRMESRSRYGF